MHLNNIKFKFTAFLTTLLKTGGVCGFSLLIYSNYSYAEVALENTVAKIKPSIVAVGTYMPKRNPRGVFLGTGFVVGDGSLVVTNAHVVPETMDDAHLEQLAIFYSKNNVEMPLSAKLVGLDSAHDLAVLKIIGEHLLPLKLGQVSSVQEGKLYGFTGFPIGMVLGLYPVTHRGIVSAITPNAIPAIRAEDLNKTLHQRLQEPYKVFQLDATAYPGNSGSPLYETDTGAVIGVINSVFIKESKETVLSQPSGISYAIPVNYVENLLKAKGLH